MATSSLQFPIAKRLKSNVAMITGGASGIGATTARLFVQQGAKVTIADIQDDLENLLVKKIDTEQIIFVHCNVAIESDVQNVVDATIAKYGKLDIIFSNAGVLLGKPISNILDIDYDIIKKVFNVNVVGAFFCAKHAARVMIPVKKGVIIFTTSMVTTTYINSPHTYTASKNAILGLSKNIGVELGKYGIRVNCVSSYAINSQLALNVFGMAKRELDELFGQGGNLKGALLDEQDVANGVLYLASDDSKYVSDLNLILDGGFSTTNVAFKEAYNKLFPSIANKEVQSYRSTK